MKILKNSLTNKIVIRCDAANSPKVGTGHLYRCINIANHLSKKFRIDKKNIIFICKTKNEFFLSKKLLYPYKFTIQSISNSIKENSIQEAKIIAKWNASLIILDRISKTNYNFFKILKTKFNKAIIFEDKSEIRKKFDLSINSLVYPKSNFKYKNTKIGFKYMLLPISSKKIVTLQKKNYIFLSFGGYDHNNLCTKVIKSLNKIKRKLTIFVPKTDKSKLKIIELKHKIIFYSRSEYINFFKKCDIAIISGGLTLFDGIYLKKKIICIPQYRHQLINAARIKAKYPINILKKSKRNFNQEIINLISKISRYNNSKLNKNNIVSQKSYINTVKYIEKIYEKSIINR